MASSASNGDADATVFYVGQHEPKRTLPVTDQVLRQAQDCGVSGCVARSAAIEPC